MRDELFAGFCEMFWGQESTTWNQLSVRVCEADAIGNSMAVCNMTCADVFDGLVTQGVLREASTHFDISSPDWLTSNAVKESLLMVFSEKIATGCKHKHKSCAVSFRFRPDPVLFRNMFDVTKA